MLVQVCFYFKILIRRGRGVNILFFYKRDDVSLGELTDSVGSLEEWPGVACLGIEYVYLNVEVWKIKWDTGSDCGSVDYNLIVSPELVNVNEVFILEFLLRESFIFVECILSVIVDNSNSISDESVAYELSKLIARDHAVDLNTRFRRFYILLHNELGVLLSVRVYIHGVVRARFECIEDNLRYWCVLDPANILDATVFHESVHAHNRSWILDQRYEVLTDLTGVVTTE